MSNILHVLNSFDPSADVFRCVRELKKYSRHRHEMILRSAHPLQSVYQFPTNPVTPDYEAEEMFRWADAVIYNFVGYEKGWGILPTDKPVAFRNINIYYNAQEDKFWSESYYNAGDLSPYKLTASSHAGAADFLPNNFRLLPDLLPIFDEAYMPDWAERTPCVSWIKHADELEQMDFKGIKILDLSGQSHATVLSRRKHEATCVFDNFCDGHSGLAGMEAMSLGLPTIVYNHHKERQSFIEMADEYPPFIEVDDLAKAASASLVFSQDRYYGTLSRSWMEKWYNPKRLIEKYWDAFVEELL